MKILVIGAVGKIAGLVIPALPQHGATVRALVSKPEQRQLALDRGATEVVPMKKSRFTEEQIVFALKQARAGCLTQAGYLRCHVLHMA